MFKAYKAALAEIMEMGFYPFQEYLIFLENIVQQPEIRDFMGQPLPCDATMELQMMANREVVAEA